MRLHVIFNDFDLPITDTIIARRRRLVTGKPTDDGALRHSECDRQRLSLHLLLPGIYSLLVSTTRRVLGSLLTSHVHVNISRNTTAYTYGAVLVLKPRVILTEHVGIQCRVQHVPVP